MKFLFYNNYLKVWCRLKTATLVKVIFTTLKFDYEYDEIDDYDENEHIDIESRVTLKEIENITDWTD